MPFSREAMLDRVRGGSDPWDLLVVGGGATGVGVAIDAAARGYRVLLLEASDFGKGTSSRSTKLVHGGVRYLRQGNVSLVMEALRERGILRQNAPHLVSDLAFVVPNYAWWEAPFYGIGLKIYDLLAGKYGFGRSRHLSRDETLERIPTIETEGLLGGTLYYDGQFDDARLLVAMARTAAGQGATLANYVRVTGFRKDATGAIDGVLAIDEETGEAFEPTAKAVVNCTGPFTDQVRLLDDPAAKPLLRPSQGAHVVLDRSFLPGNAAIMVPRTKDRRVMFAIPWLDRVVLGTTDVPAPRVEAEPVPTEEEVAFILETAARYLARDATRDDVRSVFAGIRPLVGAAEGGSTSALSREHTIHIDPVSALVTVAGGKWTTYRQMAEDAVDHVIPLADLEPRPGRTHDLPIHGWHASAAALGPLGRYGSDAPAVVDLCRSRPGGTEKVHAALPLRRGEVAWAAREEMARTVDDVLARRSRSLILDARAAREAAPAVAALLAAELGRDEAWARSQAAAFDRIAAGYLPAAPGTRPS